MVSDNRKTGDLGEDLACRFLVKHGFSIKMRNYWKKWGEIDIIAEKEGKIHFVEVKSVLRETSSIIDGNDEYRPEENVHYEKRKRLSRVIETYILDKIPDEETPWQIDLMVVFINKENKTARIKQIKDIIIT